MLQAQGSANSLEVRAERAWSARDWKAAARGYQDLTTANPKDGKAWYRLGYCYHSQGELESALAAHIQAARFEPYRGLGSFNAAYADALLGNADQAIRWLETAVERGFDRIAAVRSDADLASIRQDPRFARLLVGARDTSKARGDVRLIERREDRVLKIYALSKDR